MTNDNCIFCKIVAGTERAIILDTWPDTIAIRPLNPVVPGHILFIPKNHVDDFVEDPVVAATTVARASEYIEPLYSVSYPERGFNLITSAGEVATQSVFHLHVHVVPRRTGDGLKLPWSGQNE